MFTLMVWLLAIAAAIYVLKHIGEIIAFLLCCLLFALPFVMLAAIALFAWVVCS